MNKQCANDKNQYTLTLEIRESTVGEIRRMLIELADQLENNPNLVEYFAQARRGKQLH